MHDITEQKVWVMPTAREQQYRNKNQNPRIPSLRATITPKNLTVMRWENLKAVRKEGTLLQFCTQPQCCGQRA